MLNVIIIEQTPFFRLGIKYFLEKRFDDFFLTDFATLRESKSAVYSKKPDLVFFGVDTEFTESSEVHEVKKLYPDSRLIVCDPNARAETGIKYLSYGVKGYLSKRSDMTMLGNCVKTVLEDKFYIEPSYLESLIFGFKNDNFQSRKQIQIGKFSFSHRQHEIALLLAQGMTNSEISITLGIQASTVSTIKSVIYKKLNINSVISLKEIFDIALSV